MELATVEKSYDQWGLCYFGNLPATYYDTEEEARHIRSLVPHEGYLVKRTIFEGAWEVID